MPEPTTTTPAAPAATPAATDDPSKTAEEASALFSKLFDDDPPFKPADKPEEKPADQPAGEVKPEAKPETKPAEAETKPAGATKPEEKEEDEPPPRRERYDPAHLVDTTARAVARAMQEAKTPTPADEKPELTEQELTQAAVDAELEKINPTYKGLATRRTQFAAKEQAYADQWEAANPGQAFDCDDEAHAEWYKRHGVDVDSVDLAEARARIALRREMDGTYGNRLREMELRLEEGQKLPVIRAKTLAFEKGLLTEVAPDFAGEMSEDVIRKFAEEGDPLAVQVASQVAQAFTPAFDVAQRMQEGLPVAQDHRGIHTLRLVLADLEQELSTIAARNPRRLEKAGRQWLPLAEYQQLPPAARSRYWTTGYVEAVNYMQAVAKNEVKRLYDVGVRQVEAISKRRLGSKAAANGTPTPPEPAKTKAAEAKPAQAPTAPVSVSVTPASTPTGGTGSSAARSEADILFPDL